MQPTLPESPWCLPVFGTSSTRRITYEGFDCRRRRTRTRHCLGISSEPTRHAIVLYGSESWHARAGRCIHIDSSDTEGLAAWAEANGIDLTVVGPEGPLNLGIVDAFERRGLRIFGPNRAAAEIEGSKVFAKELMHKYGIPTAAYHVCTTAEEALATLEKMGAPVVVKADGLAAGKGALVCQTLDEAKQAIQDIMVDRVFGDSGNRVVIEEFLVGEEASFARFCRWRTLRLDGTGTRPQSDLRRRQGAEHRRHGSVFACTCSDV